MYHILNDVSEPKKLCKKDFLFVRKDEENGIQKPLHTAGTKSQHKMDTDSCSCHLHHYERNFWYSGRKFGGPKSFWMWLYTENPNITIANQTLAQIRSPSSVASLLEHTSLLQNHKGTDNSYRN
jgi:hypothetical protein